MNSLALNCSLLNWPHREATVFQKPNRPGPRWCSPALPAAAHTHKGEKFLG